MYEWGPEGGRRVLLIHGISTPSIALAHLAHQLVGEGYRVMLFGRCHAIVLSVLPLTTPLLPCSPMCTDVHVHFNKHV